MKLPIYLDNHSTTRVDPRVLDAMLPYFTEHFGNAVSTAHEYGWAARDAVQTARAQVAGLARCEASEVIFTSGATESINLVLKGIARQRSWGTVHIVTCVTEHSAVLDTCGYLESLGARVTRLPVQSDGTLDLALLEQALLAGADILSLMHANNEIGTIHPIEAIGQLCRQHGVLFHVDAAQSFGKIPIKFCNGDVDFLSISGHKLYAAKGVGCLLVKRRIPPLRLAPLIHGGGHERGFRSGTLNAPGIVALGRAAEICAAEMADERSRTTILRDILLDKLRQGIPDILVNGGMKARLAGNLNVSFDGIDGHFLLPALRKYISVSSGSACTSSHPKPSHVLAALGRSNELGQSSLRFGIGRFNTEEEILYAADATVAVVRDLRGQRGGGFASA